MMTYLLLIVGLVLLVGGAELLVKGASRIAAGFGISPLIIGLTVVAFGTSAPEMAISVSSALKGESDIAVGNVLGSNIFNVLFILGVAALISLSSAMLKKSVRGGLVVVGEVTLGGTIEPIHNAVTLAEAAVEKGAKSLLLPVSCRRQLFDLSDDMATKLDIEFYQDGRDALLKALAD